MELDFPSIYPALINKPTNQQTKRQTKKTHKHVCKQKGTHKTSSFLFAVAAVGLCWVLPDNNDVGFSSVCVEEYCLFACSG